MHWAVAAGIEAAWLGDCIPEPMNMRAVAIPTKAKDLIIGRLLVYATCVRIPARTCWMLD
jgi:hypothetical protein